MRTEAQPGRIEAIRTSETRIELPPMGGISIFVPRNGEDYRGKDSQNNVLSGLDINDYPELGDLMPEAVVGAKELIVNKLGELLQGLSVQEMAELDIVVSASDSTLRELAVEGGTSTPKQRCVETAEIMIEQINMLLEQNGLSTTQLLNNRRNLHGVTGKPSVIKDIEDMRSDAATINYFLRVKEVADATGENPWALYERDDNAELRALRVSMGVEGPKEVSERMQRFLSRTTEAGEWYLNKHNGNRRLLVIAVAPRDLTGPFINMCTGLGHEGNEVPRIQELAGFSVVMQPDGDGGLDRNSASLHVAGDVLSAEIS